MAKALIVNPYWDTLGGGERYTGAFVRLLLDKGWSADILWHEDLSAAVRRRFGLDLSPAHWIAGNYSPLSALNYQLVFWLSDGSLPISLASKTVIHFQFPFSNVSGKSPANLLKSRFYSFVTNSRFTASFINPEFGIKSHVIYPPVNTDEFRPGPKSDTILYVGRFSGLTQAKGQDVLIEAFSRIHSRLPGWRLVLAGGTGVGTEAKAMENLHQKAAGLPVEFVLNPDLAQIKKLYAAAAIFWSAAGFGIDQAKEPSRAEHFGMSVVEAMAAGCVPLVTALGGHREIVEDGKNGCLWETTAQLEELTLDLVSDRPRLSSLSRLAVTRSKMFSAEIFKKSFTDLLHL